MVTTAEAMGISVQRRLVIIDILNITYNDAECHKEVLEQLADHPDLSRTEKIFAIYTYGSASH